MTPTQAEAAIRNSAGRFFACTFIKTNGDQRVMRCRYATVLEVQEHRERPGVLTVYDDEAKGWRSIPIARLQELRIDGVAEEVRA